MPRLPAPDMNVYTEHLRNEFLRLLTEDGPTPDRRRKGYNQAIFSPEGWAVWNQTTLDMVIDKFDRAAEIRFQDIPDA